MSKFEMKYDLMLKKDLLQLYEDKLIKEFELDLKNLIGYKKDISPIIYASILNKKMTPKPRNVFVSNEFSVSDEFEEDWNSIKLMIQAGEDVTKFMSKGVKKWNKVDYLLFSCNIVHIHFRSDGERGVLDELIFGVIKDDQFYALTVGSHQELYKPDMLFSIAEANWPNKLFTIAGTQTTLCAYEREQATDPTKQFNLCKPLGVLDGHQHTTLCTLNEEDGKIRNVPLRSFIAYENELLILENIENKLAEKHGAHVRLRLTVDFDKKVYKVRLLGILSTPYIYPFSQNISCSSMVSEYII